MADLKNEQWLKEYNEFSKSSAVVPHDLSAKVIGKVGSLLNPSAFLIFVKVFGVHLAVGTLSLAFCHQFGLNPFNTEKSLADWFMQVGGHGFCMVSCGLFFTSISILSSGYFLTTEEVRVFRKTEILQALCLSILSLGAFAFWGAEIALTIAGLWMLGALIGSFAATEVVWRVKRFNY